MSIELICPNHFQRGNMQTRCCDEVDVDWSDPIMWSNDDDELHERVAEVMYMFQREEIPDWWYKKMYPWIIRDIIASAEMTDHGLIFDARTGELDIDRLQPWPAYTVIFDGTNPKAPDLVKRVDA